MRAASHFPEANPPIRACLPSARLFVPHLNGALPWHA